MAVYDDAGNIREIVGSIIDIDERKRMEAEQAAIRDQALEASRLKSEFLATVSHEIRTPLNGVIGMADLLMTTQLDTEQVEYVNTIAYSADSLLVVINDVLDLSKVEAGKLAQSVVDLLLPGAREKGISLKVDLSPKLPMRVRGYEARVRQVLLNLVGNAVKFTEQGGVTISVASVLRDRRGDGPHYANTPRIFSVSR